MLIRNFILIILTSFFCSAYGQIDTIIYLKNSNVIKEEGKIKDGIKTGMWKEYYIDRINKGLLKRKTYHSLNGFEYKVIAYSGKDCSNRITNVWNNKEVKGYSINHGKCIVYYCNGKIKDESYYKNDDLICSKSFYENGNIKNIQSKEKGSNDRRGKWLRGYENGVIREKGRFTNGLKIGLWEHCYENGQLKSKGKHIAKEQRIPDVKTSEELIKFKPLPNFEAVEDSLMALGYVSSNGMVPIRVFFKTGKWQYWDDNGKLIRVQIWKKGDLIEDKKYDKQGNLLKD